MQQVTIEMSDEMFRELQRVSEDVLEMCYSPERWAQEALEAALATRRLLRVRAHE
jgi:predicted transcriptional regulator